MQFLIVLSAALALASATPGYLNAGYIGAPAVHGGYASNILTPTGDTIEVAAAKADHFQAHANARAGLVGHGIAAYGAHAYGAYGDHAYGAYGAHAYGAYGAPAVHGGYASNILTPSGDTIEVAAAKAQHFQAHVDAKGAHVAQGVAAYGANGYGAPAYGAYGAYGAHGIAAYGFPAVHAAYGTTHLVDPVAIAAGAPLPVGDTVEVAAAKAAHFQAHVDAKAGLLGRKKRSPGYLGAGYGGYGVPSYGYSGYGAHVSPLGYAAHGYGYAY